MQSSSSKALREALGPPTRLLSIICQGRNDGYMGNFLWRLATAINRHAKNIRTLGVEGQVEILVTDWGSEVPLHKVLALSEDARELTRFLMVPPALARSCDRDSTYSGVHPTNAAARRARGTYTLFSDSDVYIPLESMATLLGGLRRGDIGGLRLEETYFWASKWHVPYDFVQSSPKEVELEHHIASKWESFRVEKISKEDFIGGGVCLLMPRSTWWESRGWDESLIYWGWYDIDWHRRLAMRNNWDLLEEHRIKIFHLEHYSARFRHGSRDKENKMKANPQKIPVGFAANDEQWGLAAHPLEFVNGYGIPVTSPRATFSEDGIRPTSNPTAQQILVLRPEIRTTPDLTTPTPSLPPLLIETIAKLKPRVVALLTRGICGAALAPLAEMRDLEKIFVIDEWRGDIYSDRERRAVPQRNQNEPFASFLADVEALGLAERVCPIRARWQNTLPLLADLKGAIEVLYCDAPSPFSDQRLRLEPWIDLLTPNGSVIASGPEIDHLDGGVSTKLEALAGQHEGFFLELGGMWGIIPLSILTSVQDAIREAIRESDARLAEKVAQLNSDTAGISGFLAQEDPGSLMSVSDDLRTAIADGQTFHSIKRLMST